jgi:hypothetical protein
MPIVIETEQEFIARHGGEALISSDDHGRRELLLETGAKVTYETWSGQPIFHEPPPQGSLALLKAQLNYHRSKAGGYREAFIHAQRVAVGRSGLMAFKWDPKWPPPQSAWECQGVPSIDMLLEIKEMAVKHLEAIKDLEQRIQTHPDILRHAEAIERRHEMERERERREEVQRAAILRLKFDDDEYARPATGNGRQGKK